MELGCGCGTNLFSLWSVPTTFRRLQGLDMSFATLQAAREIAAHFRVPDVDFQHIDLLDHAHPAFRALEGKTVFTYHCLEQLRHSMGLVIDVILKACPKRVVHIEPTREVLNPFCLLDLNCIVYSLAMDYQITYSKSLRSDSAEAHCGSFVRNASGMHLRCAIRLC